MLSLVYNYILILHVDWKELTHFSGIDWWGGFDKWLSCSSRRKVCFNFDSPYHIFAMIIHVLFHIKEKKN